MDGFWVFGYGSLIWRPGFAYAEREIALLTGYHRSFCMRSIHYRGTAEAPGLVLALDPEAGATCQGVAYRVAEPEAEAALAYLRARELVSDAYRETRAAVTLASGAEVEAVCYVMDTAHDQYAGRLPLEDQAEIICRAHGSAGPNHEYLSNTVASLEGLGISDPDLHRLRDLVEARRGG
ncbi:gamma-glutamylcyclotransferase [Oceanomicrobium pacificus]|uniref:glutathione-specific gamma-glutamylcyclotransferase n=1 Tax=Oceanomicrobium pacificus TaxID=2692916 RepID=A0A6B0TR89_9RHOB|nr:gamma-glutamylcyclotransferase [Oceanomicrobium pacificus]MXU64258.1 gamma-glutamylcyclotransferase [Oceanomicrobium pacificus]